jgi:hypothetical protein
MRKWTAWCLLAGLVGCTTKQPADQPEETRTGVVQSDLDKSIEVEVGRDTVRFVFHVTNSSTQPLVLEFNSSARYDFEVRTPGDAPVWRWSAGQMHAQVLGADTVAAGETLRYSAVWAHGNQVGRFVATGRVLASNQALEQRADFEIQKR